MHDECRMNGRRMYKMLLTCRMNGRRRMKRLWEEQRRNGRPGLSSLLRSVLANFQKWASKLLFIL
jgi:hypothetical protein